MPKYSRKAIVILGPTGAGKSALALELAKTFGGAIITADSRQIYRGMDIGTEKPTRRRHAAGDRATPVFVDEIPHYLIDMLTPDQQYSAAEFREDAQRLIANLSERRILPMIVGGTGFYVRVLTGHRSLPDIPPDPAFRAWAETQPVERLAEELRTRAPDVYASVDTLKNKRRVVRALEIARARPDGVRDAPRTETAPTRFLKLALIPPPEVLRERLASRVTEEFRRGLVEEVRSLVDQYGATAPGLQAVGYRQVLPYLRGETSLEDAQAAVLRAHRDYARRQLTWLKTEPELVLVASAAEAHRAVSDFLGGKHSRGTVPDFARPS